MKAHVVYMVDNTTTNMDLQASQITVQMNEFGSTTLQLFDDDGKRIQRHHFRCAEYVLVDE